MFSKPRLFALSYVGQSEVFDVVVPQLEEIIQSDGTTRKGVVLDEPIRTTMTLEAIEKRNPRLHGMLVEVLHLLDDEARAKAAEDIADPAALRSQALAIQQKEHELRLQQEAMQQEAKRLESLVRMQQVAAEDAEAVKAAAEADHARILLEAAQAKADADAAKAEADKARADAEAARAEVETAKIALSSAGATAPISSTA